MITRIGAAILALIWIHGAEQSAQDAAQAVSQIGTEAPRAALEFCSANASLCKDAAMQAVTASISAAPAPARADAPPPPKPTDAFPLPPRRPQR